MVVGAVRAWRSGGRRLSPVPLTQITTLVRAGAVRDVVCAAHAPSLTFYMLADLGDAVCGHPGVCHGGLTAALVDDAVGGAAWCFKSHAAPPPGAPPLPPGPAFTAQLDIRYIAPVPAGAAVCVEVSVESVAGRKTSLSAALMTQPDGVVRLRATALLIVPRAWVAGGGGWKEEVVSEAGVERLARASPRGRGRGG